MRNLNPKSYYIIRKSLNNALAGGALALVGLGSSALAEDATINTSDVTFPNPVRCETCSAAYHVLARTTKDNAIRIKLEQISVPAGPITSRISGRFI